MGWLLGYPSSAEAAMVFYKRFFEISFDLMCVCNTTHFLEVNEAMCRLLGYSRDDLLSRSYYEFMHPDDVAASRAEIESGMMGKLFENRYITKAGKTIWLRWTAHPDVDCDGAMHCVAKDITSEKIIANQLGRYVIDLQRSERAAKQAKEEAEMLAYAASHDLQEPLRTIINWSTFLKDDYGHLLPEDGKEQLRYIYESATRGRELVMDLLQLSRVGREIAFDYVDTAQLVDKAVLDVEFSVRDTGAQITRDPQMPTAWVDASMLRLLFKNLLSNAIKFAKPGERPKIHISGEETSEGWLFRVRDEGIGMDPAYTQKVFGVFQRLDPRRSGTGIGLAICQKIVKLHDGRIWIESAPGEGATVLFTVSRQPSGPDTHEERQDQAHPARRGPHPRREDAGESHARHVDSARSSSRLGRLGSAALLAANGSLRDRSDRGLGFARSQLAAGFWVRGARGRSG